MKAINTTILVAISASLVMFFYPAALIICFLLAISRFTYCVVPVMGAFDFSWKSYALNVVITVVWLAITITASLLLAFGSALDQLNYEHGAIQQQAIKSLETIMLDFECAGSRVWLIVVVLVIPNILILFKVLTN